MFRGKGARVSAPLRRGAAPYPLSLMLTGVNDFRAFTPHFPAPVCELAAELAVDMARFCVRDNGAKSSIWFGHPLMPLKSDLFKGIRPPHARHLGPRVRTPGSNFPYTSVQELQLQANFPCAV